MVLRDARRLSSSRIDDISFQACQTVAGTCPLLQSVRRVRRKALSTGFVKSQD
jgi:hypothetical protein